MLEPRIVAARIHGLASTPHGRRTLTDRITASSLGGLMDALMNSSPFPPGISASDMMKFEF